MEQETVTITYKELEELRASAYMLECLRAAGVDNWDGYDYAQEMYNEGPYLDD